ncbi:MAG: hypothetical protein JWM78_2335 [Verrucomicrobiaceae bacterium]|nr:hypothetical protein [Verrucomicrobiaceae bacterium]
MRSIDLTPAEWLSLGRLPIEPRDEQIPLDHKQKLIRLGVASEKIGRLVATFEGRLMLRERNHTKR